MSVNRASMKRKYILIPLLSGAVALTACKDKPKTTAPATPDQASESTDASEVLTAPKADPIKASATPEVRAKKLGFAKNLPKDIVHYEAMFNGRKAFDQFMKTGLGEMILQRMSDEGLDMEDVLKDEAVLAQIASYSEEYFAAYGKGSEKTFELGVKFFERLIYYSARAGVFVGDGLVREGEDFNPESPKVFFDGPLKGSTKEMVKMIADFNMPTFYQGSKISDQETRDLFASQMEEGIGMLAMMGEASEPITIKRGDSEFSGFKIIGEKLADMIIDEEDLQEGFDLTDIQAFKKELSGKSLVVVSGVVGDYVLLFLGGSEDDLVLVDNAADSICANEKMVFIDQYLEKDILLAGYSDASIVDGVANLGSIGYRMVTSFSQGLKDGLGEASSLGDTQDVEVLLESLANQGTALAKLFTVQDAGYVVMLDQGLKVEVYGGPAHPALNMTQTHSLAPLAGGDSTVLFANWVSDKSYNEKLMEYIDTLGETSYLVAQRVVALDLDNSEIKDFRQGVGLFEQKFRKDALEMWGALRGDLASGLGAETALVVDLNGSFPKIPDVPATILKEGKMPRISYVSTVDDRSKLQSSWSKINDSAESMLKTFSEMAGTEYPMQLPMSSEKNDLKTWFIPFPIQNDDFVPSISVSDELFFASTSKLFSEGLAEKFTQGGGDARHGAWLRVDFKLLNQYAGQWLKLVSDHADEVIPSESIREDFVTNKPLIEKALQAFDGLDDMTLHTRNEGGRTRASFHLKTK